MTFIDKRDFSLINYAAAKHSNWTKCCIQFFPTYFTYQSITFEKIIQDNAIQFSMLQIQLFASRGTFLSCDFSNKRLPRANTIDFR